MHVVGALHFVQQEQNDSGRPDLLLQAVQEPFHNGEHKETCSTLLWELNIKVCRFSLRHPLQWQF